jgi:hypothetical protein
MCCLSIIQINIIKILNNLIQTDGLNNAKIFHPLHLEDLEEEVEVALGNN